MIGMIEDRGGGVGGRAQKPPIDSRGNRGIRGGIGRKTRERA